MEPISSKLLELLATNTTEKPHIQVRLTLDERVEELIWDVDRTLAEQLEAIMHADRSKQYRYRLSLSSFWDSNQQQHVSYLTRTYRDHSDAIYFPATEDYTQKLLDVKNNRTTKTLKAVTHSWLTTAREAEKPSRFKRMLLPLAAASIAITVIFSMTGYTYLNEKALAIEPAPYTYSIPAEEEPTTVTVAAATPAPTTEPVIADSAEGNEAVATAIETPLQASAHFELTHAINYRIPKGTVALTFDDGPSEYTQNIVDILLEHEVGGTFFFIGQNVKAYPDHVAYAHDNGYAVGNHSYSHRDYTRMTYEQQEQDLLTTNQLIEDITGESVTLFRPPFGANNTDTSVLMTDSNSKMVLWNSDPEDWKKTNHEDIFQYVRTHKNDGAIILLHENARTVETLPQIIAYLKEQNLQVVTLK